MPSISFADFGFSPSTTFTVIASRLFFTYNGSTEMNFGVIVEYHA